MRITDSVLDFIYKEMWKYSIQIGISERELPNLIFTKKEVLGIPQTVGRRNTRRYRGVFYQEINTIFLNVKMFDKRERLRHTIIHELVHKRFPYMSHGPEFEKRIKQIRNGKAFDPYKPKNKSAEKERIFD